MRYFVLSMALFALACSDPGAPDPTPADSVVVEPRADSHPVADSVDAAPVDSVAPASPCQPSLVVSESGNPTSSFVVKVNDCPNADADRRAEARARFEWGGAAAGYGTGQLSISVVKDGGLPAEVGRFGSKNLRLSIGSTTEAPDPISSARTDEQHASYASYTTAPFDASVQLTVPVRLRRSQVDENSEQEGTQVYPAYIRISFRPADGSDRQRVDLLRGPSWR